MRKSKFTDSQILAILKEYEQGQSSKELARKYGFHYQTLHDWKKKFSGISSTKELARIKELESENNRLKKMFANLSLEYEAIKDVLSKKW
jgi:putative transposase